MREAGLLVGRTLELLAAASWPGVTTADLDRLAEDFIRSHGGIPNFQLVPGYSTRSARASTRRSSTASPATVCCEAGDVLSVDCGAEVNGWNGDAAFSVVVGGREAGRPEDLGLIAATEASLYAGIAAMRVGAGSMRSARPSRRASTQRPSATVAPTASSTSTSAMASAPRCTWIPRSRTTRSRSRAQLAGRLHRCDRADGHARRDSDEGARG